MFNPQTRLLALAVLLSCVGCQAPQQLWPQQQASIQAPKEVPVVTSGHAPSQTSMLLQDGKSEIAEPKLRAALERNPNSISARTNLGILLAKTGREAQAAETLKLVLEQQEDSCPANVQLGLLELQALEVKRAEHLYRRCLVANPEYTPALLNLGILLEIYKGDFDEALQFYERYQAVSIEPDRKVQIWIANLTRRLELSTQANQIAEVLP